MPVALEVKSGATQKTSGINAFRKHFGQCKSIIIGTGGLPWQEFLKMNPGELFVQ